MGIAPAASRPFPSGRDERFATPPTLAARGIALRHARDDDLPWLRTLYAASRADEMAPLPWPGAAKRAFLDQQFAAQHAHYLEHHGDADFLAIERDGAPIGRYYLQRTAPDHLIVDITIDARARGQGIAGALIAQTQDDAAALGRGVRLHVHAHNAGAQRLYRRCGFVANHDDTGPYLGMRWGADAT